jgi:hypothetical protein
MDAATLQSRIYFGYGKAAQFVGYPFTLYRPAAAVNPISPGNIIGPPLNAGFTVNASSFNFNKPGKHQEVLWLGLFDGSTTLVGDYLFNASHGTYFIAAQQDELPILCVKCSHVVNVARTKSSSAPGPNTYSGTTKPTQLPFLTAWPASLVMGNKSHAPEADVPMDMPSPMFEVLLPSFPGADIRSGDLIFDDNNPPRKYIVAGSELSALGWRVSARLAVA